MCDKKLQKVSATNPEAIMVIKDWVDTDVETFLANGVIKAEDIPKKREELFKRYLDLFYSLL